MFESPLSKSAPNFEGHMSMFQARVDTSYQELDEVVAESPLKRESSLRKTPKKPWSKLSILVQIIAKLKCPDVQEIKSLVNFLRFLPWNITIKETTSRRDNKCVNRCREN